MQTGLDLGERAGSKANYFIAIQAEGLIVGFQRGIRLFLDELEKDATRIEVARAKTAGVLAGLSAENASDMLLLGKQILVADADARQAETRAGFCVGRNAPCPCGSGKKFKRCCGRE